jgi:SAM-dependent methyltransferase
MERPDRRQLFSDRVDLRGWATCKAGDTIVRVFAGHVLLAEFAPDKARPDAASRAPWSSVDCGFERVLDLGRAPRRFWLSVVALSRSQPRTQRTLGVALMRRASQRHRTAPRASYRRVWNAASSTLSDARYSVAGTADAGELERSGEATARDVMAEARVGRSDTVLEIGCGVGRVGARLAPHCARWIGADVSDAMLAHARRALAAHANVTFVPLNGFDLTGIPDHSIDVVYCTGVFMHLEEWERFRYIREAFRVLRPGGRLYADNFNLLAPEGWALFSEICQMDPIARPPNVSKSSTPAELEAYAIHAGFGQIRLRTGGLWVSLFATSPMRQDEA